MAVAEILTLIEKLPLREQLDIADSIYQLADSSKALPDEVACALASRRIDELRLDPSKGVDHDAMLARLRSSFT